MESNIIVYKGTGNNEVEKTRSILMDDVETMSKKQCLDRTSALREGKRCQNGASAKRTGAITDTV